MVPPAERAQYATDSSADLHELARARIFDAARDHLAFLSGMANLLDRRSGPEVAADAVSSAFEILLKKAATDPESVLEIQNMRTYLVGMVRWMQVDTMRQRRGQEARLTEVHDMPAPGASPSEQVEARELLNEINQVVLALPDRQREVVSRRMNGLPWPEIAEQLGLSRAAVERAYYRARSTLIIELRDRQTGDT